jgi:hypothetical protein
VVGFDFIVAHMRIAGIYARVAQRQSAIERAARTALIAIRPLWHCGLHRRRRGVQ